MTNDGTIARQRDIVLVSFPFSNLSREKIRPVLIISDNEHNSLNEDFICCAITSNPREYHQSIAIQDKDIEFGFLNYKSRIKPTKIFSLDQSIILKRIARLNILKSKEVVIHLNKSIRIEEYL